MSDCPYCGERHHPCAPPVGLFPGRCGRCGNPEAAAIHQGPECRPESREEALAKAGAAQLAGLFCAHPLFSGLWSALPGHARRDALTLIETTLRLVADAELHKG